MSSPNMEYLVLDAGGIIKGNAMELFNKAKNIVTIAEVFGEIRDSKSRDILNRLPYEIVEMSPSPLAIKAVFDFAKKTGDFAALSKTDLKLIALTYMLSGKMDEPTSPIDPSITAIRATQGKVATEPVVGSLSAPNAGAAPRAPPVAWKTVSKEGASPWSKIVGESIPAPVDPMVTIDQPGEESSKDVLSGESESHIHMGAVERESGSECDDSEDEGDDDAQETQEKHKKVSWSENNDYESEEEVDEELEREKALALEEDNFPTLSGGIKMGALHPLSTAERAAAAAAEEVTVPAALSAPVRKDSSEVTTVAATKPAKPISTSSSIMRSSGLAGSMKADMDDGTGWISTANVKNHLSSNGCTLGIATTSTTTHVQTTGTSKSAKARARKAKAAAAALAEAADKNIKAACVTADFSMQNVLMQMGLSIYSIDGLLIRSIKQWVLRCMACYQIHYQMDRLFCSKCGANHMSRVACSIDSKTGELHLHLKANYRKDLRGTKYNLPNPGQQGKYDGELLLREDQLLSGAWRQKTVMIKKDVKSIFGEQVTNDVGLHINKSQGIKLGLGQRNPNAAKGRERRGKKKK